VGVATGGRVALALSLSRPSIDRLCRRVRIDGGRRRQVGVLEVARVGLGGEWKDQAAFACCVCAHRRGALQHVVCQLLKRQICFRATHRERWISRRALGARRDHRIHAGGNARSLHEHFGRARQRRFVRGRLLQQAPFARGAGILIVATFFHERTQSKLSAATSCARVVAACDAVGSRPCAGCSVARSFGSAVPRLRSDRASRCPCG
jgi:hypothetical protein